MAENKAREQQYTYASTSNLVLQADRSLMTRDKGEPTGEVESLRGKLGGTRMGDRAQRATAPNVEERRKQRERTIQRDEELRHKLKGGNVLTAADDMANLYYRPRTQETRANYDTILSFIQRYLDDGPRNILCETTDEVLALLKADGVKDSQRKKDIEHLLGKLSDIDFSQLVNLGKKITDYFDQEAAADADDKIDEEQGVAVVFDEEEEKEEDETFEIREHGSDDEGEDEDDVDEDAAHTGLRGQGNARLGNEAAQNDKTYVSAHDIDGYWLQREVGQFYNDELQTQNIAEQVLEILSKSADEREAEGKLVALLEHDKFDFIRKLRDNRQKIAYCTRLKRAGDETARKAIEAEMANGDESARAVLKELYGAAADVVDEAVTQQPQGEKIREKRRKVEGVVDDDALEDRRRPMDVDEDENDNAAMVRRQVMDLSALEFAQGSHFMASKQVKLPSGTQRINKSGYDEVHVPALKPKPFDPTERLVSVTEFPEWARKGFGGVSKLNRMQSKCYDTAFGSDENMLVCAPTGAGKTNVALMTMLRAISHYVNEDGTVRLDDFKIIYIAPMKSLVQEMVGNFGKKLEPFGIKVGELTGDSQMSKDQVAETQVIVCTPEKWDIITRKSGDRSFTRLVKLIIIDEIHLLHDDRGPVLEAIVARTRRTCEQTKANVRLVGLSATLPNYADVAAFLCVNMKTGLQYFDNSFRPVPLEQQYVGVTEKKATKRNQLMNDITFEKVAECAGTGNQVLVFVHSRKDTAKTARLLREMAMDRDMLDKFMKTTEGVVELLREAAGDASNADLKELLPYGFAIHHAGLNKVDRSTVEDLYAQGHIQVLVSTATLAWGVNLPAHRVIIKGTQVYNPEKGAWVELSSMDVLQMLGRAGRPQFDETGEGIVLTSHTELQYYLGLLLEQLPVESQMIKKLCDNLNAEAVAGSIRNVKEAVQWLGYTYLYVRMLRSPATYSISADDLLKDTGLQRHRGDLVHSAALQLDKHGLVRYDKKSGLIQSTDLGRIAAHYYCTMESMSMYNQLLKPTLSDIELFRVFSLSGEFRNISVRQEEKLELQKLNEHVPIPVKESIEEPSAKINILLQAYISRLKLEGFALMSDMVYITQSAGRLCRAMFEIVLRRGWAQLADKILTMCKMIEHRMWQSMTPLRQFTKIPLFIVRSIEKKADFVWDRLFDLNYSEIGELITIPRGTVVKGLQSPQDCGKLVKKYVMQFPRVTLAANVQPITRATLRVELTITPDFQWADAIHGNAQAFWVFVEDVDSEVLLHHEYFLLKKRYALDPHVISFFVPIVEPMPPQYFIRVISDRFLGSETMLPVSFRHLLLPEKNAPATELLDLQPLPVSALRDPAFEALYSKYRFFNAIQTQVFNSLYGTDDNVLVAAPTGSGKTICAEYAIMRLIKHNPTGKCVFIAPLPSLAHEKLLEFQSRFQSIANCAVVQLTGETNIDLRLIERGRIIVSSPEHWDMMSRRWKARKPLRAVALFIVDELQLIGGRDGPVIEVICSRMRYISSLEPKPIRIIALSCPIANAKDVGKWLGAPSHAIYNFHPSVRPVPLELHVSGYPISHAESRLNSMIKPTFSSILQYSPQKPVIVFVPSRSHTRITAQELCSLAQGDKSARFLNVTEEDLKPHLKQLSRDAKLEELLLCGVGYLHEGQTEEERAVVQHLFAANAIRVLVVPQELCWSLSVVSHLVVIMDTQVFNGQEHRYDDYSITDMLQMIGRANRPGIDDSSVCIVMCQQSKKEFYKKFLGEPLPIESHLDHSLQNNFNAEIVAKNIKNKQDCIDNLTWTLMYVRLLKNPNYYALTGVTNRHLSDHLSELVERTVADLESVKCITVEEDSDLAPLNLGHIAAYYYLSYMTMELYSESLKATTKLKGLIEIITAASEFDNVPIRHRDDVVLKQLADRVPHKLVAGSKFNDPHVKANLLLQAHFSRIHLSPELQFDLENILRKILPLVQAAVDVLSSEAHLKPAIAAMELSQMIVQAHWDQESPLRQIPHFTKEMIAKAATMKVETIFQLLDLEDDDRKALFKDLSSAQIKDIIRYCNRYPSVDLAYEVKDAETATAGGTVSLTAVVTREDDEEVGAVIAPLFPAKKPEGWWVVVGNKTENKLLAIKRVALGKEASVALQFPAPSTAGKHTLNLLLMCDAYSHVDLEYEFVVNCAEGDGEVEREAMDEN